MDNDVHALRGQFVVEFGVRQAWPFLTFCDTAKTPAVETRLYIDTSFRVGTGPTLFADGDPDPAVAALGGLEQPMGYGCDARDRNELTVTFDSGHQVLASRPTLGPTRLALFGGSVR